MGVIEMCFILIVIGIAAFAINRILPIETWAKWVLNAVIAVATIAWVFEMFGYHTGLPHIKP